MRSTHRFFHAPGQCARKLAIVWLGLVCGTASAEETALKAEAAEVGAALERIDQSFRYHGLRAGHGSAAVGGAAYRDMPGQTRRRLQTPILPLEAIPATEADGSRAGDGD